MAITYEWSFPNFECDSSNVVKTIHWRYTATDDENNSASMYGSCAGSEGMDFDAMTKEHCENCVLENQDTTIEDMQSNLSSQIDAQKNPATVSKTKEW
ncbi:hypothetical protein HTVC304P_gp45 [Pelagibacter phage HTVC304P]|nr:hypothetical protein HTVC304P_gp45 [Pelagibacter phage HTVC304P]